MHPYEGGVDDDDDDDADDDGGGGGCSHDKCCVLKIMFKCVQAAFRLSNFFLNFQIILWIKVLVVLSLCLTKHWAMIMQGVQL